MWITSVRMRYPPRLAHLATRQVLAARFIVSYAKVHNLDEEEASDRLTRAFSGQLWEEMLGATWTALTGTTQRLDENGLLEKVARSLADRPLRPGREAPEDAAFSAFWVQVDLAAGTASEAARRVLETEQGKKMAMAGTQAAGTFLAKEFSRAK